MATCPWVPSLSAAGLSKPKLTSLSRKVELYPPNAVILALGVRFKNSNVPTPPN